MMQRCAMLKLLRRILNKLTLKLPFRQGLYYLGAGDSLPPPLPPEEEAECLRLLAGGCEDAKTKLIEHNLRLVVYIARKFENTGVGIEDLISIGAIGLIKAVNSFRPEKNIKLATYASRCIENEILMYLRKFSRIRSEISLDEPLNVDWDGNELLLCDILGTDNDIVSRDIEEETDRELLRIAMTHLGEREKRIVELRFGLADGHEYTQKQVADMLGISQSYISRIEKRIMKQLYSEIINMQ